MGKHTNTECRAYRDISGYYRFATRLVRVTIEDDAFRVITYRKDGTPAQYDGYTPFRNGRHANYDAHTFGIRYEESPIGEDR